MPWRESATGIEREIGGGIAERRGPRLSPWTHLARSPTTDSRASWPRGRRRALAEQHSRIDRRRHAQAAVHVAASARHAPEMPSRGASLCSERRRAGTALAEMEVVADRDAADAEPADEVAGDEVERAVPARCASKVITTAPSRPVAARRRSLSVSSVRRNCGTFGLEEARGCGSKVTA